MSVTPPIPILFMGTAELSCMVLRRLAAAPDLRLVGVVAQPDKPHGRELRVQHPPVKRVALDLGLPVLQPERARAPDFIEQVRQLQPALIAVAAYGQILPQSLLDLPQFGCLNVHTSLLPRYRGAAPIQWALLNGDSETGVTIMKMEAGLDTGPVVAREVIPILAGETAPSLHDRLAAAGAELLVRTIPDFVAGLIVPVPQPAEGVTYAPKIRKQDGEVQWNLSAKALVNRLRALVPWPGVFTFIPTPGQPGRRLLKIWEAQVAPGSGRPGQVLAAGREGILVGCGDGGLCLTAVQIEGGKRMSAADFLAGRAIPVGLKLG